MKRFIAGDKACTGLKWTDQMKRFTFEIARHQLRTKRKFSFDLLQADLSDLDGFMDNPIFEFRIDSKRLTEVQQLLKQLDLFDSKENPQGKGIFHIYKPRGLKNNKVVSDYATGLIWQQSGSNDTFTYTHAEEYIRGLNKEKFCRFQRLAFADTRRSDVVNGT